MEARGEKSEKSDSVNLLPWNRKEDVDFNQEEEEEYKKKTRDKLKKSKNRSPAELSNDKSFNPYTNSKLFSGRGSKKMVARDPRFSDFSGKLNMDMFQKSYSFLNDMREEETRNIKEAIRTVRKFGTDTAKGMESMKKIEHLNIKSVDEAKRALDRYNTEKAQLKKKEELRELKKTLVKEEKKKIATTLKKPYYFPEKKVKAIYNDIQKKKVEESMNSTDIVYGPGKHIHKMMETKSRRKLPKERKHNSIPSFRDV